MHSIRWWLKTQLRLRDAAKRLSPKQREVFRSEVAEGLSYKVIAVASGRRGRGPGPLSQRYAHREGVSR
jgi:hypothetical protein